MKRTKYNSVLRKEVVPRSALLHVSLELRKSTAGWIFTVWTSANKMRFHKFIAGLIDIGLLQNDSSSKASILPSRESWGFVKWPEESESSSGTALRESDAYSSVRRVARESIKLMRFYRTFPVSLDNWKYRAGCHLTPSRLAKSF